MIVFSAKVSTKHRERLLAEYPEKEMIFCDSLEEVEQYLAEAEIYVTFGGDVDEALIEKAKKLKWIACLAAGVDSFPFEAIKERGIILTNSKGIHKIQMAEYAISMFLQVYRQSKEIIENEKHGEWDNRVRIKEITGKTMLILGTGAIGGETARIAKAFRMNTIGISRSGRQAENFDIVYNTSELMEALPKADLIVSVLPQTPETTHLLTYASFKAMKSSAVFLNMGRGSILIEDDLLRAIQEEEIAHAVLDVFDQEPLPATHPFWKEKNITVTPHISGLSPAYVVRALKIFEHNLLAFDKGEGSLKNTIDLVKGY